MSVKNFKITTGLDLDGLVLNVGAGNALYWNNDALATQTYVTDQISGINVDYASMAGDYIDWTNNQFNVNIPAGTYLTAGDIPSYATIAGWMVFDQNAAIQSTYLSNPIGSLLDVNISALVTELTVNQGLATQTDVSNIINDNYGGTTSTYSGSFIDTRFGSYTETSQLDTTINGYGYLKSADLPTMYTDSDARNAINSVIGSSSGLVVGSNDDLQVDTTVIATKAYADSIAQGLDIKGSVVVATTANLPQNEGWFTVGSMAIDPAFPSIDGVAMYDGARVLVKNQTTASENGIYVFTVSGGGGSLVRADDATVGTPGTPGTLTKGAFTFVENGTNAGKGFVLSTFVLEDLANAISGEIVFTQFSETGNYITSVGANLSVDVNGGLTVDLSSKQDAFTLGTGLTNESATTIGVDLNAIAGTGITVSGGQLTAAPGYISTVDASFSVTDGELSLSDTITIASVELTDSVASVTAASDVFGNASTSTYAMGSAVTIGTLPTGAEVADVFVTLKGTIIVTGLPVTASRTSKLTYVNTGGEAPTWTEYGIINSGAFPATTISFDSSGNIIANVTGSDTYSVKGVVTILK